MSKLGNWMFGALFYIAFLAVGILYGIGWDTIVHDRIGFFILMMLIVAAASYGAVWGLNILIRGAWRMATDADNRKSNGLAGAIGLTLGIVCCGAMLCLAVKAAINLFRTL